MRIFQVFLQVAFLPNAAFGQGTDVGDGSGFDTDGSGARRRRGDGDGQALQRWKGDKSIATWTAVGRWPLTNGYTRKYAYEKMFDNNVHTYWKGVDDENNKVIVSFNSPIMFHKLEFIARPDTILKQERYQDVCLYLNNVNTDVCTDSNKITESGETIVLEKEMTNVKTVELRFKHAPAAVAELDIYYKDIIGTENCYEDNEDRILPVFIGHFYDNEESACIAACKGYKYAGMEAGNECWCGDILPAAALKRPGECTKCYGYKNEMCGGHWRISIFDVPVCYGLPELADRVIPTLEKTWNLVMHVRPNGVKEIYTNLFDLRLTIALVSDSQLAEEGRLARVMLVKDSTKVSFQFWQNGIKEKVVHSDPLEMNVWSTVEVRQELKSDSKYYFSMWVNGIQLGSTENTQPAIFNNVHVFLGTDGGSLIEPAADICDSWFHTASNSISLYGKIVPPTTECKAWGDPHITTFDGANNDVYGVTTYVLAQSKSTDESVKKFRVRMVTSKYGTISRAAKALLDFYDDTGTHVATVETDKNGNANLFTLVNDQWISQPVDKPIMKGAGYRFSFTSIRTKLPNGEYRPQLTVLTDFKVQVSQIGINIYVTIPKEMYSDKVEGLCGNNDADMTNDYQKRNGDVLPYTPVPGTRKGSSEYECAKSWIVSETINSRSISNEAGPHPASVSCTDETIIAECDTLLEPSWLSICEPLVSADRRAELVRLCKIDYCMVKEEKTKLDIIMHYVIECQKKSEETILCDWEVQATGQQPVCGSNEEYKGCATMCDLPSCNDYLTNKSCNFKTKTFSSCVCKKDFYLLNGVCVAADACSATGWSDWNHWSSCSNPCGGSRRRLQICQGSECTTSSQLEEEACSGDCNPCVEAHCHMDSTCENNDGAAVCKCNDGFDGDGTTCLPQAVTPVFNPCPSIDCWTYDTATQTCAMEPACATLSCGATAFDVSFKSALFNLEENQSPVTFAGGLPSPSWDGIQWTTNAPLGLNGMTYNLDAENNEITFSIKLAIVGNDMKTRSDDVQDTLIELGSQSVITTPFGAAVILSCRYSMTIEVASQDYTVDGASVVDTVSETGSLAAGFVMTLNNGDHANFLLGNVMPVGITWSVTGLSSLTFHLQSCTVQHGATIISIVKGGCYAEKLDVLPDTNKQGFSYQVFKGVGETDPNQKISCEVNICEVGQCQIPTANIQCPTAGDDHFYSYKI